MPMVRHYTVRKECNVESSDGLTQDSLERGIVHRTLKQRRAFSGAVHRMENVPERWWTASPWHGDVNRNANAVLSRHRSGICTVLQK